MEVKLVVSGTQPLLDVAFEPLYLYYLLSLVNGVDTNMQEGQFSPGWFKLPSRLHLINEEAALGILRLD